MDTAASSKPRFKRTVANILSGLAILAIALANTGSAARAQDPVPSGPWDPSAVRKPAVLHDADGYKMWYDGDNGSGQVRIGLATSPDGVRWEKYAANPVLDAGPDEAPNPWGTERAPFVLKDGDGYKMWYERMYADGTRQLDLATSEDGLAWTPYASNPVLPAGPDAFDEKGAAHGTVIYEDGVYKLWYHALGVDELNNDVYQIAYATSADGINWTKQGPVLAPGDGAWGESMFWGPSVLKDGETYRMWYSANGANTAIGAATSQDGVTWTTSSAPVVTATDRSFGDPAVLLEDGMFKMWFHDYSDGKIYYATSNNGTTWDEPIAVLGPGVWGFLVAFPQNDAVEAWEWAEGTSISLSINGSDIGEPAIMAPTTWGDPRTFHRFEFGSEYDLQVADAVTVTDGVKSRSVTVANLAVTGVDALTDTVTGTADPGALVLVWSHEGGPTALAIADQSGNWSATLQDFDMVEGTSGRSQINDANGSATAVDWNVPRPRFTVFPEWEWFDGMDWPDGAVNIIVQDKPECTTTGISAGYFFNGGFPEGCDVQPGDTVTFSNATTTRQHLVQQLSVTSVDTATDTVFGTASPWAQLEVWPHETGEVVAVSADENGTWQATLPYDIAEDTGGRSQIVDEQGNATAVDWYVDVRWFTVFPEGPVIEGWGWPTGATMQLTIDDISTPQSPDLVQTAVVSEPGGPNGPIWIDLSGQFNVEPGDVVTLSDGITSKTHHVQALSFPSVDAGTNVALGTAAPGAEVVLWAWQNQEASRMSTTADENGNWAADFDDVGYDVQLGDNVRAEAWEGSNDTAIDRGTHINYDIYTYDPLTGTTRQVTNMPNTGEFNPSWSPNGKLIAYIVYAWTGSPSIYITNLKTGRSNPLRGGQGGDNPAWSPDGTWIAFDRSDGGLPGLYLVPAGGGGARLVRSDALHPAWAPGSKRLVFQQPSDGSLRTKAVNGGRGPETLIAYDGANPAWSPDGKWIAYQAGGDIWKIAVNAQGAPLGEAIQVTKLPTWDDTPSWSADSQTIAFFSGFGNGQAGSFDIWTVGADGSNPAWLTGAPEFGDFQPVFARNSSTIAYSSYSGDGQAARQWRAAYTYDLPAGTWAIGPHSYHIEAHWDGGSNVNPSVPFTVSADAPSYEGYVLLRPAAIRANTGDGCPMLTSPKILPDQPTRFHVWWATDYVMTYAEAQAQYASLVMTAFWDDQGPVSLQAHEIMTYIDTEAGAPDMCKYTEP